MRAKRREAPRTGNRLVIRRMNSWSLYLSGPGNAQIVKIVPLNDPVEFPIDQFSDACQETVLPILGPAQDSRIGAYETDELRPSVGAADQVSEMLHRVEYPAAPELAFWAPHLIRLRMPDIRGMFRVPAGIARLASLEKPILVLGSHPPRSIDHGQNTAGLQTCPTPFDSGVGIKPVEGRRGDDHIEHTHGNGPSIRISHNDFDVPERGQPCTGNRSRSSLNSIA
jgi:hypothetical protein